VKNVKVKKNEKMLNLNLFIQMILLFTTYREPREPRACAERQGALTPVKAEKNKYKKGGPVRETTKLFCPEGNPAREPPSRGGGHLWFFPLRVLSALILDFYS
jgi:hypothetical protein